MATEGRCSVQSRSLTIMTLSRRRFLQWTAALAATAPHRLHAADARGFRPELLPTQHDVWDQQVWMAKLGPKYTGNPAHVTFVDFLAGSMEKLGLDVQRDRYTFDRWEATSSPMVERGIGMARQIGASGRSRSQ